MKRSLTAIRLKKKHQKLSNSNSKIAASLSFAYSNLYTVIQ